jgi:Uma2 family endonuclease
MATATTPITGEDLVDMPDDGIDRWIINGELRERPRLEVPGGRPMTVRNRIHCRVTICTGTELELWCRQQPPPRGQVLAGDAGVRISRDPEQVFGIDVLYVSADVLATQTKRSKIIDGLPRLAVEILSPSDTIEEINDKIDALMQAGVPLVWVIDPDHQTVTVYRPDAAPQLFNIHQELVGDPHLPGLRIPVARLFE